MDLPVIVTTVSLVLMLIMSVPIGVSLGASVVLGIIVGDVPPMHFMQKLFMSLDNFPLLAVPFFIMAGEIMQKGTMADALLKFARCLVGHITGGLAHVSTITCLFYGALSGSSPATVAAVGGIMIPAMHKEGYPLRFSTAVNTASGCLGVIIPPSIPMIMYGSTVVVSIGDLFIAGILPGIFIGVVLMLTSYVVVRVKDIKVPKERHTLKETFKAFYDAKHAIMVPVIVLGGIYGGVFTPTEAGAVAITYAFVAEGLLLRRLTWQKIVDIFKGSALSTVSIFFVMTTACCLGHFLFFYNVQDSITEILMTFAHNKYLFLSVAIGILLFVGTFMDSTASIIILSPLMLPVAKLAGIDPIHFGIVVVIGAALGFLTPPVGVNLFVACGISGLSVEAISMAVLPFLFAMLAALFVLAFTPQMSLLLL